MNPAASQQTPGTADIGGRYARYVLGVLMLVYVFNFIDRQIISILAEEIKADLGVTDSQLGFLYGTVFAVFYAVFGIPLGRLADVWSRKSLIATGLAFWSAMTALSGTARGFGSLAGYRIGVGIGEASATPAAFSMLSDYFSPKVRATVLAIYSGGIYIGVGIGIFLGGVIIDTWNGWYPDPAQAPFGLKAWQAAFFAVGIPGILMGLWVASLREPVRGQSEGIVSEPHPHPFREALKELRAILPLINLHRLAQLRAGPRVLAMNLAAAALIALVAWLLIGVTGTPTQWIALGAGLYCSLSWVQVLALRDPETFSMIFRSRAFVFTAIGFPCVAFVSYGVGFWAPPFFQRVHGVSAAETGTVLGLSAAIGGLVGITFGGWAADRLRKYTPRGKLYVGLVSAVSLAPCALLVLKASSIIVAYVGVTLFNLMQTLWIGPAMSTVNDLVLPGMRAIASAFFILTITFIGLALGPYTIGHLSDVIASAGVPGEQALRQGMTWGLVALAPAIAAIVIAILHIEKDEAVRMERAGKADS